VRQTYEKRARTAGPADLELVFEFYRKQLPTSPRMSQTC
jgi:hypothetical protein